jgi:hypothetical protein
LFEDAGPQPVALPGIYFFRLLGFETMSGGSLPPNHPEDVSLELHPDIL